MLAQVWTRGFVLCFFAHSLQWVIYEKNQEAHETFFFFFFLFSGNDSDRVCLAGLTMEKNTLYYTLAVILSWMADKCNYCRSSWANKVIKHVTKQADVEKEVLSSPDSAKY